MMVTGAGNGDIIFVIQTQFFLVSFVFCVTHNLFANFL